MGGRHVGAVAEHFQHVADIDHEGAVDERDIDPFASAVEHFEARRGGQQDGEALVVGVRADARTVCRGSRVERVVDQA
ncbi:hypothetical protein D3C81_1120290 [compost metagenome]